MNIKEPTGDQCSKEAVVFENESKIGYACWYPQMGGYVGSAVAIFDKAWKHHRGGCIDVLVWHDGEFPFSESDGQPNELHHCDPEQFIQFGQFMKRINDANMIDDEE